MAAVPSIGDKFNQQFELLENIGSGGVSTVFKAKQIDGGDIVALKILHTVENDDAKFKARFLTAVEQLNKFRHANVARVLQFGESDTGLAYVATEYIEGTSLRRLLKAEERLTSLRAVKIAQQIAEILEAVHAKGLIHRDVKTDNIIFADKPESDVVKLVDFANTYLDEGDSFVRAGTLIGSPRYISPEQGGGKAVDARSDVYSLTVCLFEMFTGDKPYAANTSAMVLYKALNDPIPEISSDQIDRFLPAVNEFISKGMAKEPAGRFASMTEFSSALKKLGTDLEGVKPKAVVKRDRSDASEATSKGFPLGSVGIVVGILLAIIGTALFLKPHSAGKADAEFVKYQSEKRKKTVAFLEKDVRQLERSKASHEGDAGFMQNLGGRLLKLSQAQLESGDLPDAKKSDQEAMDLFSGKGANLRDPDLFLKLQAQMALILVRAQDYDAATAVLAEAQKQVPAPDKSAADGAAALNVKESWLIPARIELNIHLHKFDLAAKDLASAFVLSHAAVDLDHSDNKELADAPPAVQTARKAADLVSAETFKDGHDKLTALSLVDVIFQNLLETDKDLCKQPSQLARKLLSEIPSDTPGFEAVSKETNTLVSGFDDYLRRKDAEKK